MAKLTFRGLAIPRPRVCWWLLFVSFAMGWLVLPTLEFLVQAELHPDQLLAPSLPEWDVYIGPIFAAVVPTLFWRYRWGNSSAYRIVRDSEAAPSYRATPRLHVELDQVALERRSSAYLGRLGLAGGTALLALTGLKALVFYKPLLLCGWGASRLWLVSFTGFLTLSVSWLAAILWHIPLRDRVVGHRPRPRQP